MKLILCFIIAFVISPSFGFKHRFQVSEIDLEQSHPTKRIVKFGSDVVDVDRDLFTPSGENLIVHHHRSLGSMAHETLRTKLVYLPDDLPRIAFGEIIGFDLFDDVQVVGRVDHVMHRNEDSVSWTGDIKTVSSMEDAALPFPEEAEGHFGLTCHMEYCVANIVVYTTNQEFLLSPSAIPPTGGKLIFTVSEIKLSSQVRTGVTSEHFRHSTTEDDLKPGNLRTASSMSQIKTAAVDTDLIMDVIVLYTPQAVTKYAGGR